MLQNTILFAREYATFCLQTSSRRPLFRQCKCTPSLWVLPNVKRLREGSGGRKVLYIMWLCAHQVDWNADEDGHIYVYGVVSGRWKSFSHSHLSCFPLIYTTHTEYNSRVVGCDGENSWDVLVPHVLKFIGLVHKHLTIAMTTTRSGGN